MARNQMKIPSKLRLTTLRSWRSITSLNAGRRIIFNFPMLRKKSGRGVEMKAVLLNAESLKNKMSYSVLIVLKFKLRK